MSGFGGAIVDIIGAETAKNQEKKLDALKNAKDKSFWEYEASTPNTQVNTAIKFVSIALVLLLFLFLFKTIDPLDKTK